MAQKDRTLLAIIGDEVHDSRLSPHLFPRGADPSVLVLGLCYGCPSSWCWQCRRASEEELPHR